MIGMQAYEVLVVRLGWQESRERFKLRDDRFRKDVRGLELLDVRRDDALLIGIRVKERSAILMPVVGSLTILGRWIVRREEDLQELCERDLRGIVGDAYGFCVT